MTRLIARHETASLVAGGQACFLAMMAACVAIEPSMLAVKRGLSFYGNDVNTIVPYVLGFVLCVGLTSVALARLRAHDRPARRLRRTLVVIVALMTLVPLTPYSVDLLFDYVHIGITTLLFSSGLLVGAWLALHVLRTRVAPWLYTVQVAAGALVLAAQIGWHVYMIPSELVFQISLAFLVVLGLAERVPAQR